MAEGPGLLMLWSWQSSAVNRHTVDKDNSPERYKKEEQERPATFAYYS